VYALCGISLYAPLARALAPQRPFHALFVPNDRFDGAPAAGRAAIAELAAAYWARIAAHHRGGPLHLLGFCYGGMLAFEVAQLARAAGAEVGAVVLVDTALWGVMRRNRPQQIWRRLQRTLVRGAPQAAAAAVGGGTAVAAPDLRAVELYERAKAYRPTRPFDGHCLLVRPRASELLATWRATPFLGWEPWLTGRRELVEVDGAHDALLHAPAVDAVAKRLSELP
jgi:thioesterase domain-containing protein